VGAAVLVVDLGADRRARATALARTLGPTLVAMLTMFAVNASRGQNAARPVVWHPPGRADLAVLVDTVGQWVLGDRTKAVLRATAALVVPVLALVAWRLVARARPRHVQTGSVLAEPPEAGVASPGRVGLALAAFAVAQLVVIALTSALLDADVSFDRRLALPVELACTVLVVGVLASWPRRAALGVGLCVVAAVARTQVTTGPFPQGLAVPEPAAPQPAYELVGAVPAGHPIATNVPEFLWAATGRASVVSPASHDKLTDRDVDDFEAQLAEMGRLVGERNGVLLILRTPLPTLTRPDEVARILPCAAVTYEDDLALVYDLTPCAPAR
jgi:hypothetical protein